MLYIFKKISSKILNKLIPASRFQQVSGTIKAIFSSKAGELIVQTSNEENAMLIVIGSRGLGKVRRTILGSVSDYVLHHAACPVFICRK